jgi:hypothetical protein
MYTYKIRMSYNDDSEDLRVGENELQHAYYAFMTEGRVVLPSGPAIRGKDIISILEDPIASMGWNANYQPTAEEWGEIQAKIGNKAKKIAEKHKLIAEMIIQQNRPDLLGKPEALQLLPEVLMIG